jgi:hypothetical protein
MWQRATDVANQVKNMVRRGYLLATYTDGKILRARVKTGEGIENDRLDVVFPVGFTAHVKAGPKVEILTTDVGGDPSRRVVLSIFGDREQVPIAEEGEAFFFTPGDKSKFVRIKTNGAAARAAGRAAGLEISVGDIPISMKTDKGFSLEATEGINLKSDNHVHEGNFTVKGDLRVEGNIVCTGTVTAAAFVEG